MSKRKRHISKGPFSGTIDSKDPVGKMKPGNKNWHTFSSTSLSIRIIQSLETMLSIEMKIAHSR